MITTYKISLSNVGEPDLNKQKKGEAKLPAEAVVGKGKDGGEVKFYEYLTGRKNDTHAVRMHVSSLMRDGSLSTKRDIVAENDSPVLHLVKPKIVFYSLFYLL